MQASTGTILLKKKSSFLCTNAATGNTTPTYLWSLYLIRCDFGSENSLALQMMVANLFFSWLLVLDTVHKKAKEKVVT